MKTPLTSLLIAGALISCASFPILAQSDKLPASPPPTAQNLANEAANNPKSNLGEKPAAPGNLGQKLEQLGSQQADEKTAAEARDALTQIVNDALTPDKFSALRAHLAAPDRQRIGEMQGEKFDALDKTISQLRADFQQKYSQPFTFKPEYLKNAEINLGPNADTLSVSLSNLEKTPAVNPAPAGELPSPLVKPSSPDGKDIPSKTGLSVVSGPTFLLINESHPTHSWKLDIPNEITGRQLRDTLKNHLQKIEDQKTTWSQDPAATYRAVATEVFQALQDSSLVSDQ